MGMLWLIGEDATHAALVEGIVRGVIKRAATRGGHHWLVEDEGVGYALQWRGEEALDVVWPGLRFTPEIKGLQRGRALELAPGRPVKLRGWIDGRPQQVDAAKWRHILSWVKAQLRGEAACVIIACDTDGDAQRLSGLRQVLEATVTGLAWVLAAPHQDAESWFVLGWTPRDTGERGLVEALRGELGFDPIAEAHQLTARPNDSSRDAKRVLRRLRGLDARSRATPREELAELVSRCLGDVTLLETRDKATGLRAFICAVEEQVCPLMMPGQH